MPIDIASYRRWQGRARPTPFAALAIATAMVRRRMRIRFVRMILWSFALVPSVIAVLVFYFSSLGSGPLAEMRLQQLGLKDVNLLSVVNLTFDSFVGFWAGLLAALVGAPLIAEDRRANALPLYFSRPIGHVTYVVGKAAAAAWFLALLLILPRLCMYVVDIGLSEKEGMAMRHLPTLLRACAVGGLGVAVFTSIALGVSSVTERPTYASLFFMGIVAITSGLAFHLRELDPGWLAISPYACVRRIGLAWLDVPPVLRVETGFLEKLTVRQAWFGVGGWIALGLGTLLVRVRRVEIVT